MSLKHLFLASGLVLALAAPAWAAQAPHEEKPAPAAEKKRMVFVIRDDGDDHGHGGCPSLAALRRLIEMAAPGDGEEKPEALTRDAFLAEAGKAFDALDADHDGRIDPAERRTAQGGCHMKRVVRKDVVAGGPADPPPPGDIETRIEVRRGPGEGHGFEAMDADKDGRISWGEFSAPLRKAFERLDKDHSGFIEKSEWPAADLVRMSDDK